METPPSASGGGRRTGLLAHNAALDGLRGIAVIGVLLFHSDHLIGGYLGVDAFFVLSGFLITSLLIAERRTHGNISLKGFWFRRARRLIPAMFLVLVAVLAYAAFVATPQELAGIRRDALATLAYVANWNAIAQTGGYFAAFTAPSPLKHTWSLAIEEQFYLLWPIVVIAILGRRQWRHSRSPERRVFFVCAALTVGSVAWAYALTAMGASSDRIYFGTDTRMASLTLGAALAAWLRWRGPITSGPRTRYALEAVAIVAVGLCGWAWFALDGKNPFLFRGGLILCALGVAAVLASVSHPTPGVVHRVFSWRPLAAVGIISYGLYLWHWPIYVYLSPSRTGLDGWSLTGARIGITLILAIGSYVLVEAPIRYGRALTGWTPRIVTPTFASILVVVTFSVTATATNSSSVGATAGLAGNGSTQRAALEQLREKAMPGPKKPDGPNRVLVVGDSVAYFLGDALAQVAAPTDMQVFNAAIPGCGLAQGPMRLQLTNGIQTKEQNVCSDRWADLVQWLHPDQIVVAFGAPAIAEWQRNGTWQHACEPEFDTFLDQALRFGLSGLQVEGASATLVVLPEPKMDWAPAFVAERNACTQKVIDNVARSVPNARPLDLAPLVCPNGNCQAEVQGVNLRPDGLHFADEGARIVARWIADRIRPPKVTAPSTTGPASTTPAPETPSTTGPSPAPAPPS